MRERIIGRWEYDSTHPGWREQRRLSRLMLMRRIALTLAFVAIALVAVMIIAVMFSERGA